MLFLIEWTIPSQNRIECWNNFGNMSPADDLRDTGDLIQIIGRWHHINGCGGVCICCTDNSEAFNSWMLNWSPLCDIKISPVVNDTTARESLQNKPYFNSIMNKEEKSNDCGEKCECSVNDNYMNMSNYDNSSMNEEEKSNDCGEKCECSVNDNYMNMSNYDSSSMNDINYIP